MLSMRRYFRRTGVSTKCLPTHIVRAQEMISRAFYSVQCVAVTDRHWMLTCSFLVFRRLLILSTAWNGDFQTNLDHQWTPLSPKTSGLTALAKPYLRLSSLT